MEYENDLAKRKGFEGNTDRCRERNYRSGLYRPYDENTDCAQWLGINVAEKILPCIYSNVMMMPINNKGFDAICSKGYKIDIKGRCITVSRFKTDGWGFPIRQNKLADCFILFAFDNRKDLNLLHVWIIKGNEIIKGKKRQHKKLNDLVTFRITNLKSVLSEFRKYELSDELLFNAREICKKVKEGMVKT